MFPFNNICCNLISSIMKKVLQTKISFYPNKIINVILRKTKKAMCYLYNEVEKKLYKISELLRDLHSSFNYVY